MNTQTKETKHTPGPWTFDCSPSSTIVWSDECGRSREICKVTPRGEVTGSEGEANARLIAAAPELLEACKALKSCLGSIHFPNGDPECVATSLELAQQAITKAEGRGE